ncbi:hypothetical protein ACH5RR_023235 [Cinchona calisaya]|uniref:Cytochrome c oxidase polypeptide II n=1 Tax=Cinchona calisaya TaxID=153742 RepID=A0ABD2ZF27_9GENT
MAGLVSFQNEGSPLATTTVVVAKLLGWERITYCSCSSFFASGIEFLRVGVERFFRGNLQVQFEERRALTEPYEYLDYNSIDEQSLTFDSYMILEDDPELGQSCLLEVDNRVVVPAKTNLSIVVTPAIVPRSWAVPSLGVKYDAVLGHLNQTSILVQREGVYYGQCSGICGTNHAFMPIVVEAVDRKDYASRIGIKKFIDFYLTGVVALALLSIKGFSPGKASYSKLES